MNTLYLLALGLAAAIAPCPLASNVAAIGYLCRNVGSRRRSVCAGLLYTLGRMLSYVVLGLLVSMGLAGAPVLSHWLQETLPMYMGPVLLLCGLVVLECISVPFLKLKPGSTMVTRLGSSGLLGSFLLGALFALALCPPSAAIFFGTALPLAAQSGEWAWVSISFFGLGTSLLVVAVALLLALSATKAAATMKCLPTVQKWSKYVAGGLLFLLGAYMTLTELIL